MGTVTPNAGNSGAAAQDSLSPGSATVPPSVDAVNAGLASVSAAGVADGDKGDITVAGPVWTVDANAITYAKMQDISATDRLLGRSTAGAGDPEEIVCTAAGRALLDDADAAAQRATLGLGTMATLAAPSAFAQTLLDDADAATARATLGVGTGTGDMLAANNLSDVVSAATARTNLGLGTMATLAAPSAFVQTLLDDADAATARTTLGAAPITISRRDVSIATDTILAADNGGFIDYTNTGAIAVSITTAFSGLACQLTWPASAGTITLTPTGVTLNGSASAVVLSSALGAVSVLPVGTNAFRVVGAIGELVAADITDASANGVALITAADYASMRTLLGLGTIATLAAPSAFVQTLLDDADAATARTTLGAGTGNGDMVAANNLSDVASAATARTNLGLGTMATLAAPSAFAQTLLDDADAATARATLGAGTGNGDMVAANNLSDVVSAATARTNLGAAAKSQAGSGLSFFKEIIADKDYTLIEKAPHGGTITEATTKCASGTATVTFKINGVALGGVANAASSTPQSQAQASSNVFAAGDRISMTVSANAACVDLAASLTYTRVLA